MLFHGKKEASIDNDILLGTRNYSGLDNWKKMEVGMSPLGLELVNDCDKLCMCSNENMIRLNYEPYPNE